MRLYIAEGHIEPGFPDRRESKNCEKIVEGRQNFRFSSGPGVFNTAIATVSRLLDSNSQNRQSETQEKTWCAHS